MRRAAALVLLCACTQAAPPPAVPGPSPSPSPSVTGPADLAVVGPEDTGYLDGMELAADEEGLRLETTTLDRALDRPAPAVLVVGDAEGVASRRLDVEASGKVILLLGADLYSSRRLYRSVFQVSAPMLWEARVLARYLVTDRGIREASPVYGEQRATERRALAQAARGEGLRLRPGARARISVAGEPRDGSGEPLAAGAAGLGLEDPAPGTVAVAPYTWPGWAQPIPRVADFRDRFRERFGRIPTGPDQEGYDAVRLLAEVLADDPSDPIRALESVRDRAYAGLPITLGPDDHLLVDEGPLGLFTVPGPGDPTDPWTDPPHWRPLMRTFTYDGERTTILDRDKRIFFPRWRDPQPSPKYRRSRYGITEGPR